MRALGRHLIAVLRRVAVMGRGGDPLSLPGLADDVPDDGWAAAWADAAAEVTEVWSDPTLLERPLRLPRGPLSGARATVVHLNEFTVHTWDLASATGQRPSFDPAVLTVALSAMRGGPVPFGPGVEVPPAASDIERLVAWYGRRP